MSQVICDNVGESSTSTGTGNITLAGALAGMIAFNAIPSIAVGDHFKYLIFSVDGSGNRTTEWEIGLGTYSAANTLSRITVLSSSNSGSLVSFSAGTKYVFLTPSAEDAAPRIYTRFKAAPLM